MKKEKEKLLLVVNPTAGKMRAKGEFLDLVQIFCRAGYSVTVHTTGGRRDALRIVTEEGNQYDRIVACGGDGTLNEVVTGVLCARFGGTLGFLPCGTTNDLARSLNVPEDLKKASELAATGEGKPLDVGSFNRSRYFSYIAAFGAFTEVSYTTDQTLKNILGHAAYLLEAARTLKNLRTYRMKITCDGVEYEDDFLFGAVTNSISVGGVLKLKETDVELYDGFHEVLLIRDPKTRQDFANLSRELISGHFENKSILFFRSSRIVFDCQEKIRWCVDGEFAGEHDRVEIRNVHDRLRVIYP